MRTNRRQWISNTAAVLTLVTCGKLWNSDCSYAASQARNAGFRLIYQVEEMGQASVAAKRKALASRLRNAGFSSVGVQFREDGRVYIEVPRMEESSLPKLRRLVETPGILEFRILAKPGSDDKLIVKATTAAAGRGNVVLGDMQKPLARWVLFEVDELTLPSDAVTRGLDRKQTQALVLMDAINLTGQHIETAEEIIDTVGQTALSGTFSDHGGALMEQLTSMNLPDEESGARRALGVILDGQLIAAPQIMTTIGTAFQVAGNFTAAEVNTMATVLKSGPLPFKVNPESVVIERLADE